MEKFSSNPLGQQLHDESHSRSACLWWSNLNHALFSLTLLTKFYKGNERKQGVLLLYLLGV